MIWALTTALLVTILSVAGSAQAAGRVVIVKPTGNAPAEWPEATRSVLAEFALAGFEVVVEPSRETQTDRLLGQLRQLTLDEHTVAGVLITRAKARGVGYVWIRGASRELRLIEEHPDSTLGHNAFALRLVDLMRERRLTLPATASIPRDTRQEQPSLSSPLSALSLHTAAGITLATADAIAPRLQFGGQLELNRRFFLSLSGHSLLAPLSLDTEAGTVHVSGGGVSMALLFDPRAVNGWGAAAGAAAGMAWFRSEGQATASYLAHSDRASVATLSLLAVGRFSTERFSVTLSGEPQWLLPGLRITTTDGREIERVPFALSLMLGLGWRV